MAPPAAPPEDSSDELAGFSAFAGVIFTTLILHNTMSVVNKIQKSEYTGENRCRACTVINIVFAICSSSVILLTLIRIIAAPYAVITSIFSLFVFLLIIWVQGYLIPGTPMLTKHYMPPWILSKLGKESADSTIQRDNKTSTVDIESFLVEAGAIEPCEDIDDLCLVASFADEWHDEMSALPDDVDSNTVLQEHGFDLDQSTIKEIGDTIVLLQNGDRVKEWPSETAVKIDVAGARVLSSSAEWGAFNPFTRSQILSALRIFLNKCPSGDPVTFNERTVESCCSTHNVIMAVCSKSGDRIFEQPTSST